MAKDRDRMVLDGDERALLTLAVILASSGNCYVDEESLDLFVADLRRTGRVPVVLVEREDAQLRWAGHASVPRMKLCVEFVSESELAPAPAFTDEDRRVLARMRVRLT